MLNSDSLKKCHEIISKLDECNPLWIANNSSVRELSFISNVYDRRQWIANKNKSETIYHLIKTHENLEEYLSYLTSEAERIVSDEDVCFCNVVLSELYNDRYISQALVKSNIVVMRKVEIYKYIKYVVIKRILATVNSPDAFAFWQEVNDFSSDEQFIFNGRPFKFNKRFIYIMYGYASGSIREAYAGGIDMLDRYKSLLTEIFALEKHNLFNYLPELHGRFFYNDNANLSFSVKRIEEAKAGIISTRNDDTLTERALVIELLKLFHEYGNAEPVSAVYKFSRSNFLQNDIERKTIQRCWNSLSVALDKIG